MRPSELTSDWICRLVPVSGKPATTCWQRMTSPRSMLSLPLKSPAIAPNAGAVIRQLMTTKQVIQRRIPRQKVILPIADSLATFRRPHTVAWLSLRPKFQRIAENPGSRYQVYLLRPVAFHSHFSMGLTLSKIGMLLYASLRH